MTWLFYMVIKSLKLSGLTRMIGPNQFRGFFVRSHLMVLFMPNHSGPGLLKWCSVWLTGPTLCPRTDIIIWITCRCEDAYSTEVLDLMDIYYHQLYSKYCAWCYGQGLTYRISLSSGNLRVQRKKWVTCNLNFINEREITRWWTKFIYMVV